MKNNNVTAASIGIVILAAAYLISIFYLIFFSCYGIVHYVLTESEITSTLKVAESISNFFKIKFLGWPNHLSMFCIFLLGAIVILFSSKYATFTVKKIKFGSAILCLVFGVLCFQIPLFLGWLTGLGRGLPNYSALILFLGCLAAIIAGNVLLIHFFKAIGNFFAKNLLSDIFNKKGSQFAQQQKKVETPYSVNLPTEFINDNKKQKGWLNITNPFRATALFGAPGSGKSYSIVNGFIDQHAQKGFSMLVYDFKYPTLTKYTYNAFQLHATGNDKRQFCVINFDDVQKSHRCNPISPSLINTLSDARQVANVLVDNSFSSKGQSSDFFTKKAKTLLTNAIWFLKNYEKGKYCTLPHLIEFASFDPEKMLVAMSSFEDVAATANEYLSTLKKAAAQSAGEFSTLTGAIEPLKDKNSYWVLTGDDFTLDINDPDKPKVLCIGNNPARSSAYSPILALFTSKIMELTNQQGKAPCSLILDEFPTMKFEGIDNFVATCRSNLISCLFGAQSKIQYDKMYDKQAAESLLECCNNLIVGAASGETASMMVKVCGKKKNIKESFSSSNKDSSSTNTSIAMEDLVTYSQIKQQPQGHFVATVVEDAGSPSDGIFFGKVITKQLSQPNELPLFYDDLTQETIDENFYQIKKEIENSIEILYAENTETKDKDSNNQFNF